MFYFFLVLHSRIFKWLQPSGVTDGLVVIVLANESFFSDGTGSIPPIGAIDFLEFLDQFHHFTKQKYAYITITMLSSRFAVKVSRFFIWRCDIKFIMGILWVYYGRQHNNAIYKAFYTKIFYFQNVRMANPGKAEGVKHAVKIRNVA